MTHAFVIEIISGMGILKGIIIPDGFMRAPMLNIRTLLLLLLFLGVLEFLDTFLHVIIMKCATDRCRHLLQYQKMEAIEDMSYESKYHSFIICQTTDKQIAEKWDYYILSSNGQLLMSSEEPKSSYEYNLSIDTIACCINQNNMILGMGDWLKPSLASHEAKLLTNYKVLRYDTLWLAKSIQFFYYIGGQFTDRFIEVTPKYIHDSDCLIFQYSSPTVQYKKLHTFHRPPNQQHFPTDQIFSFRSEYALLSDMHFLNCLVRSQKQIGSYIKDSQNTYIFWISPQILKAINSLYPLPKF